MIKANEFRIGNWAYSKTYATNIQFKSFFGLCNAETNPELYNPIPLTAEILEKCGFVKLEHSWFAKEYGTDCREAAKVMSIQINSITGRCGIGDTDFGGCNAMTGKVIKYVHQLQNLIYAITGEDFEVKL